MTDRSSLPQLQDCNPYASGTLRFFDLKDSQTGTPRRLFVTVPPGPAPDGGWPWLILLDGNAVIATATDILRAQAPYPRSTNMGWGVVIGLGYPTQDTYDHYQRSWDLTPEPGRSYPPFYENAPEARTGGAAELGRFLTEDAIPALLARLPLDPSEGSLWGHSFGGLFVLWMMFTNPGLFRHWIAASPSITWEDSNLLRFEAGFDPGQLRGELHLSAGEWEGVTPAPFQMAGPEREERVKSATEERTLEAAQALAQRLRPALGARVGFEVYPDATHMSALAPAVNRALHVAFGLWRPGDQTSG